MPHILNKMRERRFSPGSWFSIGSERQRRWPDEPPDPPRDEQPPREVARVRVQEEKNSCSGGFISSSAASARSPSAIWSHSARRRPMSRRWLASVSGVTTAPGSIGLWACIWRWLRSDMPAACLIPGLAILMAQTHRWAVHGKSQAPDKLDSDGSIVELPYVPESVRVGRRGWPPALSAGLPICL